MKTLIIYASPHDEGHTGSFLKQTKALLESKNEAYDVIDLYKENYDPILHANELYTSEGKDVAPENIKYQEMIKAATSLIFIYPVWWQNMPAILKGFLDKTLLSGFAFTYKGKMPVGLLKGKKAAVFTSSGGPRFFNYFFAKDRAQRVMTHNTLKFCGIKSKSYSIGSASRFSDSQEAKIGTLVSKAISYLQK